MMLGHGLLAFAAVAAIAQYRGWAPRQALEVGAVAGAFAALPDVDMLYAAWSVVVADVGTALAANEAFWNASDVAHRSATHSVAVAVPTAAAVALIARRRVSPLASALAAALLGGVVATAYLASGALDATMLSLFAVGAAALAVVTRRRTDLGWPAVTGAALFGLVTHPFGDLFTGGPPRLLYPFGAEVLETRLALSPDPTLHLLGVFALELVAVWLAAVVVLRATDRHVRRYVDPLAAASLTYGAAVAVIPAPTLAVPSLFVFSILGVGVAFFASTLALPGRPRTAVADGGIDRGSAWWFSGVVPDRETLAGAVLTGTAAVTVAWVAFLSAYLFP